MTPFVFPPFLGVMLVGAMVCGSLQWTRIADRSASALNSLNLPVGEGTGLERVLMERTEVEK